MSHLRLGSSRSPDQHTLPAEPSDEALMQGIASGSEGALATLVDRHGPSLYSYVNQMLSAADDTEDVVQETFVRIWDHRERWTAGGSPKAYLYHIARNIVSMRARHQSVRAKFSGEIIARAGYVRTPLDDAAFAELMEALAEAVAALPDRRREAYTLVRIHQFSLDEAATVMDLTKRTISNHVYMAMSELAPTLRPFFEGAGLRAVSGGSSAPPKDRSANGPA